MSQLISAAEWAMFQSLHETDAQDTFYQKLIIWRRATTGSLDRFKEDNAGGLTADVSLKCLLNYNYNRSWPASKPSEAGETDEESTQILFGKKYLRDLGYLDSNDYFIYNPGLDRFIIDGMIMKPMGDTSVSQAFDHDLLISVIVVRQPPLTGGTIR